jgi:hypothetical protein
MVYGTDLYRIPKRKKKSSPTKIVIKIKHKVPISSKQSESPNYHIIKRYYIVFFPKIMNLEPDAYKIKH